MFKFSRFAKAVAVAATASFGTMAAIDQAAAACSFFQFSCKSAENLVKQRPNLARQPADVIDLMTRLVLKMRANGRSETGMGKYLDILDAAYQKMGAAGGGAVMGLVDMTGLDKATKVAAYCAKLEQPYVMGACAIIVGAGIAIGINHFDDLILGDATETVADQPLPDPKNRTCKTPRFISSEGGEDEAEAVSAVPASDDRTKKQILAQNRAEGVLREVKMLAFLQTKYQNMCASIW